MSLLMTYGSLPLDVEVREVCQLLLVTLTFRFLPFPLFCDEVSKGGQRVT